MKVQVRRYRSCDAQATADVFRAAVLRTAAHYYSSAQLEAWISGSEDLAGWDQRRSAAWTVVAEIDGRVVGFADLTAEGVLDMLFVHPDRGRQGVGRALVEVVLGKARRRGLQRVRTRASRAGRPAFTRLGFVVDAINLDNTIRGVRVPNFDMHIVLADPRAAGQRGWDRLRHSRLNYGSQPRHRYRPGGSGYERGLAARER